MRLGHRVVIGILSAALAVVVAAGLLPPDPAAAADGAGGADPAPSRLALAGDPAFAGSRTPLQVQLLDDAGQPIAGAQVALERRTPSGWAPVATLTTDDAGAATQPVTLDRTPQRNVFRGTFAGDETHGAATEQVAVPLKRRASRVVVGGPGSVVDGRAVKVTVRWRTLGGTPVPGTVVLSRSLAGGPWRQVRRLHTGDGGWASLRATPRADSRWRARALPQPWVAGDRSAVHRIDNLPPGPPVRLPAAAPRPRRHLPAQPRAGAGAHVVVSRIPDGVWSQMTGASWHAGCPVGRSGLRLVRVTYWGYDGYRHRGELVASASAAGAMGSALAEMYRRRLPVRSMYRVDRFGWGARSHGGNDYASMAAGNTSAFNCRDVTGRPGVRSPHSYGRALDLNTWENPYRSAQGLVPNTWWQSHSHPKVAWRSRSHAVVRLMARHGFRWTYGLGDTQHFDYVGRGARAFVRPVPCDRYCD